MEKQIHTNFIKSSNLIFITAGLGFINFFFSPELLTNSLNITTAIFTIAFIIGVGFLVRQGYSWVKIFLLIITALGLIGIPFTLRNLTEKPIVGIINIVQTILQIWAVILLFKIPQATENKNVENHSFKGSIHIGDRVRHKDESIHSKFGFMEVLTIKNGYAFCQNRDFNSLAGDTFNINDLIKQ